MAPTFSSFLFMKKWNSIEKDFSEYFENEWLQTLDSWYGGYHIFTPSTNNSLEATNKVIKDEHTFIERHRLSRFFTIAIDIVHKWSKSRNQNQTDPIVFSTEPTITLKKWTDAYRVARSKIQNSENFFQNQKTIRNFFRKIRNKSERTIFCKLMYIML
jgi:hypothetical protein